MKRNPNRNVPKSTRKTAFQKEETFRIPHKRKEHLHVMLQLITESREPRIIKAVTTSHKEKQIRQNNRLMNKYSKAKEAGNSVFSSSESR